MTSVKSWLLNKQSKYTQCPFPRLMNCKSYMLAIAKSADLQYLIQCILSLKSTSKPSLNLIQIQLCMNDRLNKGGKMIHQHLKTEQFTLSKIPLNL